MSAPEERLAAAVAEWLRAAGWTVYAEVQVPAAGKRRADIVAVKGEEVWIVECKTRLTWAVIAQAEVWEGWAHYRSVATAHGPSAAAWYTAGRALFAIGITWLQVADGRVVGSHGIVAPQVARRAALVLDALRPEHRDARPGNADSAYHTETAERDARLRALVAERPGLELRAALDALGLRLDAAGRRAFARHVSNALDGVTAKRDGKRLLLWPAERTGF